MDWTTEILLGDNPIPLAPAQLRDVYCTAMDIYNFNPNPYVPPWLAARGATMADVLKLCHDELLVICEKEQKRKLGLENTEFPPDLMELVYRDGNEHILHHACRYYLTPAQYSNVVNFIVNEYITGAGFAACSVVALLMQQRRTPRIEKLVHTYIAAMKKHIRIVQRHLEGFNTGDYDGRVLRKHICRIAVLEGVHRDSEVLKVLMAGHTYRKLGITHRLRDVTQHDHDGQRMCPACRAERDGKLSPFTPTPQDILKSMTQGRSWAS